LLAKVLHAPADNLNNSDTFGERSMTLKQIDQKEMKLLEILRAQMVNRRRNRTKGIRSVTIRLQYLNVARHEALRGEYA